MARLIYPAVFASGLAALLYETAWIRLCALVLGSSTYSFAVMLAALISGLALGAAGASRLKAFQGRSIFALAQLGAAASLVAALPFYERLPYAFLKILSHLPRTEAYYPAYEGLKFLFCLALLLPTAACLGLALPMASRAAQLRASRTGEGVGRVFGVNALGNVLGAAAGLWLLPRLGAPGLLLCGAGLNGAAGAAALWGASLSRAAKAWALALCALSAAWCAWAWSWDKAALSLGVFRLASLPNLGYEAYKKVFDDYTLLYHKDDSNATVAVMRYKDEQISLLINGKADASTGKDMRTQVLLGQVPLILRPAAREVLVVGLGSGITAGAALRHPVARVDVVEIAPAVVEAQALFQPYNGRPLADSRCRLFVEDAKTFLERPGPRYDLIVSEPSNPWMAGIGSLFSAGFYRRARERMNPGGMMAQWLHVYEMDDDNLGLILRTFSSEFRHVSAWHLYANDVLLIGSDAPLAEDFAAMEAALRLPGVRADAGRAGLGSLAQLLALQTASDATLRGIAGKGALNEDRFPRLEFAAPKALFLRSISTLLERHDDQAAGDQGLLLRRYLAWRGNPLAPGEFKSIVDSHQGYRRPFVKELLREWQALHPRDLEVRLVRVDSALEAQDYEGARSELESLTRERPRDPRLLELSADVERELYRLDGRPDRPRKAIERLRLALRLGGPRAALLAKLARIHGERGDKRAAIRYLKEAALAEPAVGAPSADELWLEAADLAWDLNESKELLAYLEMSLKSNPDNPRAQRMLKFLIESSK